MEKGKIKDAEFVMNMVSMDVDNLKGEWKEKFLELNEKIKASVAH